VLVRKNLSRHASLAPVLHVIAPPPLQGYASKGYAQKGKR